MGISNCHFIHQHLTGSQEGDKTQKSDIVAWKSLEGFSYSLPVSCQEDSAEGKKTKMSFWIGFARIFA